MFGMFDPRDYSTIATGEPTPLEGSRRTRTSTASEQPSATATDATAPSSPSAPRLRLARRTSRSRPDERVWTASTTGRLRRESEI